VSFLGKLFSPRHQAEGASSDVVSWPGQSGNGYQYMVYPIDTALPSAPGNYIYAKQSEDRQWIPLYIAQTRDMHQRLEGHDKLQDATENGATHIHVNLSSGSQAARCSEEHDLILRWKPPCNEAVES
jgi:hypothetical protein